MVKVLGRAHPLALDDGPAQPDGVGGTHRTKDLINLRSQRSRTFTTRRKLNHREFAILKMRSSIWTFQLVSFYNVVHTQTKMLTVNSEPSAPVSGSRSVALSSCSWSGDAELHMRPRQCNCNTCASRGSCYAVRLHLCRRKETGTSSVSGADCCQPSSSRREQHPSPGHRSFVIRPSLFLG